MYKYIHIYIYILITAQIQDVDSKIEASQNAVFHLLLLYSACDVTRIHKILLVLQIENLFRDKGH